MGIHLGSRFHPRQGYISQKDDTTIVHHPVEKNPCQKQILIALYVIPCHYNRKTNFSNDKQRVILKANSVLRRTGPVKLH